MIFSLDAKWINCHILSVPATAPCKSLGQHMAQKSKVIKWKKKLIVSTSIKSLDNPLQLHYNAMLCPMVANLAQLFYNVSQEP